MTDLLECRKEIDVIDKEILRLFEKRMKVCEDVCLLYTSPSPRDS